MEAESTGGMSLFGVAVRAVLAVVLASYVCVPVPALAVVDDEAQPAAIGQGASNGEGEVGDAESASADDADAADAPKEGADESSDGERGVEDDAKSADEGPAGKGATGEEPAAEEPPSDEPASSADDAGRTGHSSAGDEPGGASDSAAPIDITADWNAGKARIDAAGDYALTADVSADEPLKVALPEGASATVDLAGFDVVVSGKADCAIDLGANAGKITFTDSSYSAKEPDERASVTLKADDPRSDVACVRVLRTSDTRGASPSATFEHVSLAVEAVAESPESYEADAAAVKTGIDPKAAADDADDDPDAWKASDETVRVALEGCALSTTVKVAREPAVLAQIDEAGAERGVASAIDAGCRGIELNGRTVAGLSIDGTDASVGAPALLSVYDASYIIGSGFELARVSDDASSEVADPTLALGFPSRLAADGEAEAVVAEAAKGEMIPAKAPAWLTSEAGYEIGFDASAGVDDAKKGFSQARLARSVGDAAPVEADDAGAGEIDSAEGETTETPSVASEPGSPLLALAVASGANIHAYADYLAANADAMTYAVRAHAQADSGVSLNAAWSDLSKPYTIKNPGVYYLSADLTAKSSLTIDAADADVVIKLNGHAMTLKGSGVASQQTILSIANARSVEIDGSAAGGGSKIKSSGSLDVWGISSTADGCTLSGNDFTIELSSTSDKQTNLGTHAIRMAGDGSTLSLTRCKVNMLMGNQTCRVIGSDVKKAAEVPSAVYVAADTSGATLTDCTVVGEGNQAWAASSRSDTTSIGNAYALYSLADFTTVEGGSYKAVSALGNATCLYAKSLTVSRGSSASVSLEADAGQIAAGVMSDVIAGAALDAPLAFSVADDYAGNAEAEAALFGRCENAFAFGDCLPGSGSGAYPVLVMVSGEDLASANAAGRRIGGVDSGTAGSSLATACSNCFGAGCSVRVNSKRQLEFSFDSSKSDGAVARVTYANGKVTYFPTLSSAIEDFSNNSVLALLRDAGPVAISNASEATLDLNGCSIEFLDFSTDSTGVGNGLVVTDGKGGGSISGLRTVNDASCAVYYRSKSPLTLKNVTVEACGEDVKTYGVYASPSAGKLTLDSSSVSARVSQASTTTSSAYGVCTAFDEGVGAAAPLVLNSSTVAASTPSAGVAVYGIQSAGGLEATDSSVSAVGTTGTTCAAYVGSAASATGCEFDAYTTGAAQTACGIWGSASTSSSLPAATEVSLRACSVAVRAPSSVSVAGRNYACLLGPTTATDVSSTAWVLAGRSAFACSGDMHFGLNLGDVALGDSSTGFSLNTAGDWDDALVISQAQRSGHVGFALGAGVAPSGMEALANAFEAKPGSYYDGWKLVADVANRALVWRPASDETGSGSVEVTSAGGVSARYPNLAEAFGALGSGDTVKLLGDLSESGTFSVAADDVVIDLNGHRLTLRGGGYSTLFEGGKYTALDYRGTGVLAVRNSSASKAGVLSVGLGAATEVNSVSNVPYQAVSVSGGGKLTVSEDVSIEVDYTGSTSPAASQKNVTLRGVSVEKGSFELAGSLAVNGAQTDGAIGAMTSCGVFADPAAGASAVVDMADTASVTVDGRTAAQVQKNTYYVESPSTQSNPPGLREITVDPETDAAFYQDLVRQFRISATYDDPGDSSLRDVFGARVYFAQDMKLDRDGAWYDGLRVWAFSDEVPEGKAGKMSSIVPSHVFVTSYYETVPETYGVATGSGSAGTANITVRGDVKVANAHGNAYALHAVSGGKDTAKWKCQDASLEAVADDEVHLIAQGAVDLRDYIKFSSSQSKKVAYSNMRTSQVVKFQSAVARTAVVGDNVSFTFAGSERFKASGLDAAAVEATSFTVDSGFGLQGGSDICSIADRASAKAVGTLFAKGATSSQASLFSDAAGAFVACAAAGGTTWKASAAPTVTFKVGDAVIARAIAPAGSIQLSAYSGRVIRSDDQRQHYKIVGWSKGRDENATKGYLPATGALAPSGSAVYYAVFETGLTDLPITFTNVYDGALGDFAADATFSAPYGSTVGDAVGDALPQPADYARGGLTYRFVGWYPSGGSATSSALVYSPSQVKGLAATLAVSGVSAGAGLVLRATYLAVSPTQHVVSFIVDDRTSVCVVEDGARPTYTAANNTNTNYVVPSKLLTETGKTFTFTGWRADANGNAVADDGEPCYVSVLPRVSGGDASYVAGWSWAWDETTYTFYVTRYDSSSGRIQTEAPVLRSVTCDKEPQAVADSVETVGHKLGFGGQIYTLLGWSTRKSDVEPMYDATNRLPSVTGNGGYATSYSKTYYGVYSVSTHMVTTTFYDGSAVLGKSSVSALKTVGAAFKATGKKAPADKSAKQQFLGWARANSKVVIDDVSTTLESLVGSTDTTLELHAVYGVASIYRVTMRTADGKKVLNQVYVRSGRTVRATVKASGKSLYIPAEEGKYFTGWRTASGAYYDIGSRVTGNTNLFASYKKIPVTSGSSDVSAVVTTTLSKFEQASSLKFTITPRDTADTPLREQMSKYGYTLMKCYDIRLLVTKGAKKASASMGDIGTAAFKVYVGSKYKNSSVRVFWLGEDNGAEVVRHTAVKSVDDKGYIEFAIGDYHVGDELEGGNLAVAYVEGGTHEGTIEGDSGSGGAGAGGAGAGGGIASAGLGGASLATLSSRGLPGTLASLSGGLAKSASASSGAAKLASPGGNDASSGEAGDGAYGEEEGESIFSDWDSDAVALMLLAALAVAALLYGLWRLVVVRQKQSETEADLPDISDRYAKGVVF